MLTLIDPEPALKVVGGRNRDESLAESLTRMVEEWSRNPAQRDADGRSRRW